MTLVYKKVLHMWWRDLFGFENKSLVLRGGNKKTK